MRNCVILLPTHSNYIDVCETFIELLHKNWSVCPYKIVISVTGDNVPVSFCESMYNGKSATLPDCIYNATRKYHAEFYLCMLGDAFIFDKWNEESFVNLLVDMNNNNIHYCSLLPNERYTRLKKHNDRFRYINVKDRYSYNFIAFVADNKFIENEFRNSITDLDFEKKYLDMGNDTKGYYFTDSISVIKNEFNIYPGIVKGKYERKIYRKLKSQNPEIHIAERELLSIKMTIYLACVHSFVHLLPRSLRIQIKKLIMKFSNVLVTND